MLGERVLLPLTRIVRFIQMLLMKTGLIMNLMIGQMKIHRKKTMAIFEVMGNGMILKITKVLIFT